jgi:catechol 2,3-dioxygenase
MDEAPINPQVRIGHVHLKVSDLGRSVQFYRDALGFEVQQYFGRSAAFLSAGGYHHHIGLNTWESKGGTPPPPRSTGLYHVAILYPSRKELARALKRLIDHNVTIDGATDHGVSEAIYLHDPDFNGLELYCDRDVADWPRGPNGELQMITEALDLASLLQALDGDEQGS